jgi:hypothetical protein
VQVRDHRVGPLRFTPRNRARSVAVVAPSRNSTRRHSWLTLPHNGIQAVFLGVMMAVQEAHHSHQMRGDRDALTRV